MTYYEEEDKVVPELRIRVEEEAEEGQNGVFSGGEYVKLRDCEVEESGFECEDDDEEIGSGLCCWRWRGAVVWYWVKLVFLISCLGLLGYVFLKWVGPFFMDKELMPIINWETTTFSTPVLAVLVFASVALFPTLLLPSTPSMWIAGMTFGYGFGFLLIITAAAVGVSLPYFIGVLFLHKIQGWLEKYPKKAAILRSAGEGNWLHRFKAVTLIRISPFPYIIYNYCAVATNVKYGPYLIGSLVGMVPEIFVAIYTGILIRALADASHEQHSLSAQQIALNIAGFCASVATTILFTVYAKKKLKTIQDEPLLPVGV